MYFRQYYVHDTLLWSENKEESFFQTCKFLTHCSQNGIMFNSSKFQFCEDLAEFAGFTFGPNSVRPASTTCQICLLYAYPYMHMHTHGMDMVDVWSTLR